MTDKTTKPHSLALASPEIPQTKDSLTDTELNGKLQHSYEQSLAGKGRPFAEVFDDLEREISQRQTQADKA